MKPLLATLTALTVLVAPIAAPVAAQGPPDRAPADVPRDASGFDYKGDHVAADINESLPGLLNVTVREHGIPVIAEVILPQTNETFTADAREDGLHVETNLATLDLNDSPDAAATLDVREDEAVLVPSDHATVEDHADGASFVLSQNESLELRGDNVTIQDDHVHLTGEATWYALATDERDDAPARSQDQGPSDEDRGPPERGQAQGPPEDTPATWRAPGSPHGEQLELPHAVDARYFSLNITADGAHNVTIHGEELGSVLFNGDELDQIRRAGVTVHALGDNATLRAVDAPATQITVHATNVTTTLPNQTTLPNNATVVTDLEDDRLHIHVQRPANAVPQDPDRDHRPAQAIERAPGPAPGLSAKGQNGSTNVSSERPDRVDTSFDGEIDGVEGNVSLGLQFERALLVEDRHGTGQVDIGDPAVAEASLDNGTTTVDDGVITNRFHLWSGTLEVNVEPGDETAKITFEASNLSAPPGTLFVLETSVDAPEDAALTPTSNGVMVDNGNLQAEYSLTGPVTVDGEDAWADRSILVDDDDTVRLLMAYPAGDNITHDPTVSVQSSPGAQVLSTLTASPWAVAAGALSALVLVGATVWQRRRAGP